MQGFILKLTKVKDEDCIVEIITPKQIVKCYRFYGARHPVITQGYKLDFELENNINFLPRLTNTLHLGFSWLLNRDRLLHWQQFMRLFYEHLKDVENIDKFYFDIIEECAIKFGKQNPKRVIIEAYVKLLEHEGRLHTRQFCFICDEIIENKVSLARSFLPAHEQCINKKAFELKDIDEFFSTKKSTNLNDEKISRLYHIVLEGF